MKRSLGDQWRAGGVLQPENSRKLDLIFGENCNTQESVENTAKRFARG